MEKVDEIDKLKIKPDEKRTKKEQEDLERYRKELVDLGGGFSFLDLELSDISDLEDENIENSNLDSQPILEEDQEEDREDGIPAELALYFHQALAAYIQERVAKASVYSTCGSDWSKYLITQALEANMSAPQSAVDEARSIVFAAARRRKPLPPDPPSRFPFPLPFELIDLLVGTFPPADSFPADVTLLCPCLCEDPDLFPSTRPTSFEPSPSSTCLDEMSELDTYKLQFDELEKHWAKATPGEQLLLLGPFQIQQLSQTIFSEMRDAFLQEVDGKATQKLKCEEVAALRIARKNAHTLFEREEKEIDNLIAQECATRIATPERLEELSKWFGEGMQRVQERKDAFHESIQQSFEALFEKCLRAVHDHQMIPWPKVVQKNNLRYDLNAAPGRFCESLWDVFRVRGVSDEALLAAAQAANNAAGQKAVQVDQLVSEEYLPTLVEALENQLGQAFTVPLDILAIDQQTGKVMVQKRRPMGRDQGWNLIPLALVEEPGSQRYIEGMYTLPPVLQCGPYLYPLRQKDEKQETRKILRDFMLNLLGVKGEEEEKAVLVNDILDDFANLDKLDDSDDLDNVKSNTEERISQIQEALDALKGYTPSFRVALHIFSQEDLNGGDRIQKRKKPSQIKCLVCGEQGAKEYVLGWFQDSSGRGQLTIPQVCGTAETMEEVNRLLLTKGQKRGKT